MGAPGLGCSSSIQNHLTNLDGMGVRVIASPFCLEFARGAEGPGGVPHPLRFSPSATRLSHLQDGARRSS